MNIHLEKITDIVAGTCSDKADVCINSVSIDTRTMTKGCVYVAIVGDNFDGHEFIDEAINKGAAVILSEYELQKSVPVIRVGSTRKALGDIAEYWRMKFDIPVVGITGSNGKTTVKELCRSILQTTGNVIATEKNNNNDIGVPLTLLQIDSDTDFAVIEMGTNHKGEIAALVKQVKPTIAAITNIGESHLAGFKDKNSVAEEKSDIFKYLSRESRAVIDINSEFFKLLKARAADSNIVSFSDDGNADVSVKKINQDTVEVIDHIDDIRFACEFHLIGKHNLSNLACAVAILGGLNIPEEMYQRGIKQCLPVPGRLEPVRINKNLLLINDSYNANPSSVRQAINVLDEFNAYKVLVLGDMGELGEQAVQYHKEIGEYANLKQIDLVITIGNLSSKIEDTYKGLHKHLGSISEVVKEILEIEQEDSVVLVKASRFMGLEKIVTELKKKAA